jgi:mRNA interferase RelE/StbE
VSTEPWRIEITRAAQRDLRRLDPPVRQRVADALRALATDPHRAVALRKLTGAPESRLRVGDWRALVLLDEPSRVILVTRVLPRGRAHRD